MVAVAVAMVAAMEESMAAAPWVVVAYLVAMEEKAEVEMGRHSTHRHSYRQRLQTAV
jgi:hypothetical protein